MTVPVPVPIAIQAYRVGSVILVPPLGTPLMWERRDVRQALATHDFSTLFRIFRAHGISQRKIAAVLECSQSEVCEIVNGRHVISYPVLVRYADGLKVPRSWLGLAHDAETESIMLQQQRAQLSIDAR